MSKEIINNIVEFYGGAVNEIMEGGMDKKIIIGIVVLLFCCCFCCYCCCFAGFGIYEITQDDDDAKADKADNDDEDTKATIPTVAVKPSKATVAVKPSKATKTPKITKMSGECTGNTWLGTRGHKTVESCYTRILDLAKTNSTVNTAHFNFANKLDTSDRNCGWVPKHHTTCDVEDINANGYKVEA